MQCSIILNSFYLVIYHQTVLIFSYTILVAEQDGEEAFNRAKLFNAGYQELKVKCLNFLYIDSSPV